MLRPDESTAWTGFLGATPRFAGEAIANWSDGPDPPDVLCEGTSGKKIGVELTKWVNHQQVTQGAGRKLLEDSYLEIIGSENEPRPDHIQRVILHLRDSSLRMKEEDESSFRTQLFKLINLENAKPTWSLNPQSSTSAEYWKTVRSWDTQQGAPVNDFGSFPMLEKYVKDLWIHPRQNSVELPAGHRWVLFESPGGAYTPTWMEQAAIDNILAKISKYQKRDIRGDHSLGEFDLVCYYCDEALLHNTPIDAVGAGFHHLTANVRQALATTPRVFDRIFLFHLYENIQTAQVY